MNDDNRNESTAATQPEPAVRVRPDKGLKSWLWKFADLVIIAFVTTAIRGGYITQLIQPIKNDIMYVIDAVNLTERTETVGNVSVTYAESGFSEVGDQAIFVNLNESQTIGVAIFYYPSSNYPDNSYSDYDIDLNEARRTLADGLDGVTEKDIAIIELVDVLGLRGLRAMYYMNSNGVRSVCDFYTFVYKSKIYEIAFVAHPDSAIGLDTCRRKFFECLTLL